MWILEPDLRDRARQGRGFVSDEFGGKRMMAVRDGSDQKSDRQTQADTAPFGFVYGVNSSIPGRSGFGNSTPVPEAESLPGSSGDSGLTDRGCTYVNPLNLFPRR